MNGQAGAYGAQPSRDPNAILNECRDIDRGIDSIQRNLERLRFLQQRAISDSDTSQNTETNRELDSLSSDTMTLYRSFAARIKSIKSQKESGDPRNKPQVGLVYRKLQSAINEYQNVEKEFRHKLSARMEREYRIVRPDASDQEVQEAIQDPSNTQVFTSAVCYSIVPMQHSLIHLAATFKKPTERITISTAECLKQARGHSKDRAANGGACPALPGHGSGGGYARTRYREHGGEDGKHSRKPGPRKQAPWRSRREGEVCEEEEVDLLLDCWYVYLRCICTCSEGGMANA